MNLTALPDAALAFVRAIRAAAVYPADQVRLMLAHAAAAALTVYGAVLRRMALVELARALAIYQPNSYEDARAVLQLVCGALDAEIDRAGDAGEDDVYTTFRSLSDVCRGVEYLTGLASVTVLTGDGRASTIVGGHGLIGTSDELN